MPLLQISFSEVGGVADYNPNGLKQTSISLLVPPSVRDQVDRYLENMAIEREQEAASQTRLTIERAQWEAGRASREAAAKKKERVRRSLIARVDVLATKYRVVDNDLLDADDSPSWVYQAIEKVQADEPFTREELEQLRKSKFKYFAAAVYWRAWETAGDPWSAVHTCSLLRDAKEPKKALKLLDKVDFSGRDNRVTGALFTTRGGAERDLEMLDRSWASAQAAVVINDASPYPFMLLGALCYQTSRRGQGDDYFRKASDRGAEDKAIEYEKRDAERRRIKVPADGETRHTNRED